jgi:hypothetical protein
MLNPVYGSVGLLWSENWKLCQDAVENVLRGVPIAQPPPAATAVPPLKTCDIRHVARRGGDIHGVANSSRGQFKRRVAQRCARSDTAIELVFSRPASAMLVDVRQALPLSWAPAGKPGQEYSVSHDAVPETDSNSNTVSVDTVEASHVSQSEPEAPREIDGREVGLDLALGLLPTAHKIVVSRF